MLVVFWWKMSCLSFKRVSWCFGKENWFKTEKMDLTNRQSTSLMLDFNIPESEGWGSNLPEEIDEEEEEINAPIPNDSGSDEFLLKRVDLLLQDVSELRNVRDMTRGQNAGSAINGLRDHLNQKIEALLVKLMGLLVDGEDITAPLSNDYVLESLQTLTLNLEKAHLENKEEDKLRLALIFQFLKEYKGFIEEQNKLDSVSKDIKAEIKLSPLR